MCATSRPDLAQPPEPDSVRLHRRRERDGASAITEAPPEAPARMRGRRPVTAKVLEIVAEQTGYPVEMLELDLDMEADLGIDTVKQAETFAAIRQAFDIPRRDDLKLRDYPTLAKVIDFVRESRPTWRSRRSPKRADACAGVASCAVRPECFARSGGSHPAPRACAIAAPAARLVQADGVTLDENSRVIVALDMGGVGQGADQPAAKTRRDRA